MIDVDTDRSRALLHWLQSVELPEQVVLACEHTALPAIDKRAIGVRYPGCLADAGLSLPAQLLAFGVAEVLVAPCATDPDSFRQNLADWRRTLDGVRPLPEPTNRRFGRHRGQVLDMGSSLVTRRLALGLKQTREVPFDLALDEPGRGLAALRILQRQGRAHLEPAGPDELQSPTEAPRVAVALLAVGCNACGVCVRACPQHALELSHLDAVSVLSHLGDACRADQACIRLCPVSALSVSGILGLAELADRPAVELARVPTRSCPRCGARHPVAEGDLCGPCQFRTANAFGSRIPPTVHGR